MNSVNQIDSDSSSGALETATVKAGRAFRPRSIQVLLFIATTAILMYHLGTPSLFDPIETRIASVARTMLESGDWLTPHLNGLPALGLPPLPYWASAFGQKLLGCGEWGARLLVPIASGLLVIACYRIGLLLEGPRAALLSAFTLMTCGLFVFQGRFLVPEVFLSLFASWMIWSLLVYQKHPKPIWSLSFWCFAALCALTSGFSGLIPLLGILPVLSALAPNNRLARQLQNPLGWGVFLVLGCGWPLIMTWSYPGLPSWWLSFFTGSGIQAQPRFWDSVPFLPFWITVFGMCPWTMFFLGGLNRALRDGRKNGGHSFLVPLSWGTLLFIFALLFHPAIGACFQLLVPASLITGIYLSRLIHFAQEEPFSFKLESALTLVALSLLGLGLALAALVGYIPDLRLAKVTIFLAVYLLFLSIFGYASMYMGFSKGMLLVMGVAAPGFMFFLLPGLGGNEEFLRQTWFPGSREFLQRVARLPAEARILNVGPMLNGFPFYTGRTVPTWKSNREPAFLASGVATLDLNGNSALQQVAHEGLYLVGRPGEIPIVREQTRRSLEHLFTVANWSLYRLGDYDPTESPVIEARVGSLTPLLANSPSPLPANPEGLFPKAPAEPDSHSLSAKTASAGDGTSSSRPASDASSVSKTPPPKTAAPTARPSTVKPSEAKTPAARPPAVKSSNGSAAKPTAASGKKQVRPTSPP